MENNQVEKELDWEGVITQDNEFVLLPEGEYGFLVEKFERSRFNGNDNFPACNQANLKIRVFSAMGSTSTLITHSLMLHSKSEWALSAFFTAIGQKKKGEDLRMNWQTVPQSRGRCKLIIEEYKGENYNKIKKFLPPIEPVAAPYTPGQF